MSCYTHYPHDPSRYERTPYDMEMFKRYNPSNTRESYNSPPWPGERTQQDINLQKRFCPKCGNATNTYNNSNES